MYEEIKMSNELINKIQVARNKLLEQKIDLERYKIIIKPFYIIDDFLEKNGKYEKILGLKYEIRLDLPKEYDFMIIPIKE